MAADNALITDKLELLNISSLKDEQKQAVWTFLMGRM